MTKRGKRPAPAQLRLLTGTHRDDRHGEPPKDDGFSAEGLKIPRWMRGEAAKAWRQWIDPAGWLDKFREPAAIAMCLLWAEYRREPSAFPASKHAQFRAYRAVLGLTDSRQTPQAPAERPTGEHDEDGFA